MPRSTSVDKRSADAPKPVRKPRAAKPKAKTENPLTAVRAQLVTVDPVVPLWQYVARYIFCTAFNTQDDEKRKKLYEAAKDVDMALVSLGYESGCISMEEKEELTRRAGVAMETLPKQL